MSDLIATNCAFRLVDFDTFAIPVHRIVAVKKDGDNGTSVFFVDGDGDENYLDSQLPYDEAIRRVAAQAQ